MPDQGATSFIREFGFPIFVVVWFMWRMEKRLDRFLELLTSLMKATALLAKSIDHMDSDNVLPAPDSDDGSQDEDTE